MIISLVIPLYVLVAIYGLVVIFVACLVAINIYHLVNNASLKTVSFAFMLFIITAEFITIIGTVQMLKSVNLRTPVLTIEIPSPKSLFNQEADF